MLRDLRCLLDKVGDRMVNGALPAGFKAVPHGRAVETILKRLKTGFKAPDSLATPLLAIAAEPADQREQNSLALVQTERDRLRTSLQVAEKEIKRLRAVPKASAPRPSKASPKVSPAVVDQLRERVSQLEDQLRESEAARTRLEVQLQASQKGAADRVRQLRERAAEVRELETTLQAYEDVGSISEIQALLANVDTMRPLVVQLFELLAKPPRSPSSVKAGTAGHPSPELVDLSEDTPLEEAPPLGFRAIVLRKGQVDGGGNLSKETFDRCRSAHLTRSAGLMKKNAAIWPACPPSQRDPPCTALQLRETPWRMGLFSTESTTPQPREYRGLTRPLGGRLPTAEEVLELYERNPWADLTSPPEPITFQPSDPRFAALYRNTRALYERYAQVLWERTHNFLLADTASRSDFLRRRRKRNSVLTTFWDGHLLGIAEVLQLDGIDADLLLDPFFYWPPAHGVLLAVPAEDQSVEECRFRLDGDEPERLYFTRQPKEHPAVSVFSRIRGKFFIRGIPRPLGNAVAGSRAKRRRLQIDSEEDDGGGDDASPSSGATVSSEGVAPPAAAQADLSRDHDGDTDALDSEPEEVAPIASESPHEGTMAGNKTRPIAKTPTGSPARAASAQSTPPRDI